MSDSLNPFSSARTMPPTSGAGDSLAIAGGAAFVIVLVSSTIGWGLWMAYRTTKILSTAAKSRTAQRVRQSRTTVSEMAALEMGAAFQKLDSCSDWEPTRLPYLQTQNSDLVKDLPTLPERAYVSGWVPFPPSLPRCQTLDAVRSPTLVAHSTSSLCGVEGVVGTPQNSTSHEKDPSQTSPTASMNLISFDQQDSVPPTPCVGLGLSLFDAGVTTDGLSASTIAVQHPPLEMDVDLLESTSENMLSIHAFDPVPTTVQLPSPLITPILPTLVLTSAPMRRILDDTSEQTTGISQLASPPETPVLLLTAPSIHCDLDSSVDRVVDRDVDDLESWSDVQLASPPKAPVLLLTAPSIHCGLGSSVEGTVDRDVDDDLESWSDVLCFQEYEHEDMSNRLSMRLLSDFPSPPEPPCSVLEVPGFVSVGSDDHHHESLGGEDGKGVANPTADEPVKNQVVEEPSSDMAEDKPFDYAAFRERLAIFLKDVNAQQEKRAPTLEVEDTTDKSVSLDPSGDLPPSLSSSTQFDYAGLRVRKRSPTLLSNKSDSVSRVEARRVGPKPLPLPEGFQPLLPRGVERSKR